MSTKNLVSLVVAAVVLAGAAYFLNGGSRQTAPQLNGRKILPEFSLSDVARVEVGGVVIAATDAGWVVESMQNYPADHTRILANLQKLQDLKVGQVAKGRALSERTPVVLRDGEGKELASVVLGDMHPKWGFGRYAEFEGETVLVTDMLEAFDGDPKRWCDTKIVDTPRISFSSLAEPGIDDAVTGFSTGVVATVTIGDDTNRVATVGNELPGGAGRYLRLEGEPWTFVVPTYSVDRLLPKEEEPEAEAAAPADESTSPSPSDDAGAASSPSASAPVDEATLPSPPSGGADVPPASKPESEPEPTPTAEPAPETATEV